MNHATLRGPTTAAGQYREAAYGAAEASPIVPASRDVPESTGTLTVAVCQLEEALERLAKRLEHVRRQYPATPINSKEEPMPQRSAIAEAIYASTERVNRVTRLLNMLEDEVQL